jgi:hypothetical protein
MWPGTKRAWRGPFPLKAISNSGFIVSLTVTLAGCGITAKFDSRNDYRASVTAYMECLATHAPKDCEGLRLAMEADERQYNALAADTAGGNSAANINIQNR